MAGCSVSPVSLLSALRAPVWGSRGLGILSLGVSGWCGAAAPPLGCRGGRKPSAGSPGWAAAGCFWCVRAFAGAQKGILGWECPARVLQRWWLWCRLLVTASLEGRDPILCLQRAVVAWRAPADPSPGRPCSPRGESHISLSQGRCEHNELWGFRPAAPSPCGPRGAHTAGGGTRGGDPRGTLAPPAAERSSRGLVLRRHQKNHISFIP